MAVKYECEVHGKLDSSWCHKCYSKDRRDDRIARLCMNVLIVAIIVLSLIAIGGSLL